MKVGDYVRTHDGRIDKIVDIKNDFIYIENSDYGYRENYLKSSPNIIDLIEVGDIIITKHPAFNKEWLEKINNKEMMKIRKKIIGEGSLILISIVTKEQFSCMEYKIGE